VLIGLEIKRGKPDRYRLLHRTSKLFIFIYLTAIGLLPGGSVDKKKKEHTFNKETAHGRDNNGQNILLENLKARIYRLF
jgi:hypothetical protein